MIKNTKSKKAKLIIVIAIIAIILINFILFLAYIDNKNVVFENIEVNKSDSSGQETIKIAHLSDFHFPKIDIDLNKLLTEVTSNNVDFIAITGDVVDGETFDDTQAIEFFQKLNEIAPIYYVMGNHEGQYAQRKEFLNKLKNIGVEILENKSIIFKKNDKEFTIIGLKDNEKYSPIFIPKEFDKKNYKILLTHRPNYEKMMEYFLAKDSESIEQMPNLILAGHAHGGQIRIFAKGLYSPSQGVFPKYTSGKYDMKNDKTNMIVSRGLGNSRFPFRVNNKPHVPIITVYI